MSDENFISEQNKFYLKTLDVKNDELRSRVDLLDSVVELSFKQSTNKMFHEQMMGLIILVGCIPIASFSYISGQISFSYFFLSLIIASAIGGGLLFSSRIGKTGDDMYNLKNHLINLKIDMFYIKSFIYKYYFLHPQTVTEISDELFHIQEALYFANFFFYVRDLDKIYDQKRYLFFSKYGKNRKNNILISKKNIKKQLVAYAKYYSKHQHAEPHAELRAELHAKLDNVIKSIFNALDELRIDYKNPPDTK